MGMIATGLRIPRLPVRERLQRNQSDFLQLIEHGDGAEHPEENATADQRNAWKHAGSKGARQEGAVEHERVPAAKAEREVVAERGPFDERGRRIEPECDDAEDTVADQYAEIDVADVLWIKL